MSLKNTYEFVFGMCAIVRKPLGIRAQEDEEQIQKNTRFAWFVQLELRQRCGCFTVVKNTIGVRMQMLYPAIYREGYKFGRRKKIPKVP